MSVRDRSKPRIRATIDLSEAEREQVEAAAAMLARAHPPGYEPCGIIILPRRPGTFLLRSDGRGFVLEAVDGE